MQLVTPVIPKTREALMVGRRQHPRIRSSGTPTRIESGVDWVFLRDDDRAVAQDQRPCHVTDRPYLTCSSLHDRHFRYRQNGYSLNVNLSLKQLLYKMSWQDCPQMEAILNKWQPRHAAGPQNISCASMHRGLGESSMDLYMAV